MGEPSDLDGVASPDASGEASGGDSTGAEGTSFDAPVGSVRTGVRWHAVGLGGSQLIRSLAKIAVVRFLLPAESGLFEVAVFVIGFLEQFSDSGAAQAVIRWPKLSRDFLASTFTVNMTLSGLVAAGLYVAADFTERLFGADGLAEVLRPLSLTFLLSGASFVHRGLLVRRMAFKRLAFIELTRAFLFGAVALVQASRGEGVWAVVQASLVASTFGSVALWFSSPWSPRLGGRLDHIRDLFRFSIPLLGTGLSTFALTNSDILIASRFWGADAVGYYGNAKRLVQLPLRFVTRVLTGVLTPDFARLQHDHQQFGERFMRAGAGIALIAAPAMLGLALVAGPLVHAIWGEVWRPVVPLVALLAPMGFVRALASATAPVYVALGQTKLMFWWGLVFNGSLVAAAWIGAQFSIEGIALAIGLANLLLFYPYLAVPMRPIGLRFSRFAAKLIPVACASAAMAAAVYGLAQILPTLPAIVEVAVLSVCGALVYGALAFRMGAPGIDDLLKLAGIEPKATAEP